MQNDTIRGVTTRVNLVVGQLHKIKEIVTEFICESSMLHDACLIGPSRKGSPNSTG
jgi:hypothetical protein